MLVQSGARLVKPYRYLRGRESCRLPLRHDQRSSKYEGTIEQRSFKTANRQFYNMQTDPDETTNLIEKRPEVVRELTALASDYVKKGRSTPGPR